MRRAAIVGALAGMQLIAFPAAAKVTKIDVPRADYRMVWLVAPASPESKAEPVARTIASGEVFLRTPLLPPSAATLEAEVTDERGKPLLAAGDELIGLSAAGQRIYCSTDQKEPSAVGSLLFGRMLNRGLVCLSDTDADGRFDYYFRDGSDVKGLPSISGRTPSKAFPVTNATYREIEPGALTMRYFVGVEYQGKPLIYNRRNFTITFGNDSKRETLTSWSYTEGSDYPKELAILGAKFSVLGEVDGGLSVRVDKPFDPQPFAVAVTTTYRTY